MKTLTVVIPALNEATGIGAVLKEIPIKELMDMGYKTEVLVIDNGSEDETPHIAKSHGATVIIQPIRGYGNAYKAGFANSHGQLIATGDADLTYPFESLPWIIKKLEDEKLDFINTDRLAKLVPGVMSRSHYLGNLILTAISKFLFRLPFRDSQSGMWVFRSEIWKKLQVNSYGMPFSQELKIEAYVRGFACDEVPIHYRARQGKEKLNTIKDGLKNITELFRKKLQLLRTAVTSLLF